MDRGIQRNGRKLEGTDIPAPRVIGSITDAACDGPAVLMTRIGPV